MPSLLPIVQTAGLYLLGAGLAAWSHVLLYRRGQRAGRAAGFAAGLAAPRDYTGELAAEYGKGYSAGWDAYERCNTPDVQALADQLRQTYPTYFPTRGAALRYVASTESLFSGFVRLFSRS